MLHFKILYYLTVLHMYMMCFDHIYLPLPTSKSSYIQHYTPSKLQVFSGSHNNSPSSIGAVCVHMDVWPFTRL